MNNFTNNNQCVILITRNNSQASRYSVYRQQHFKLHKMKPSLFLRANLRLESSFGDQSHSYNRQFEAERGISLTYSCRLVFVRLCSLLSFIILLLYLYSGRSHTLVLATERQLKSRPSYIVFTCVWLTGSVMADAGTDLHIHDALGESVPLSAHIFHRLSAIILLFRSAA